MTLGEREADLRLRLDETGRAIIVAAQSALDAAAASIAEQRITAQKAKQTAVAGIAAFLLVAWLIMQSITGGLESVIDDLGDFSREVAGSARQVSDASNDQTIEAASTVFAQVTRNAARAVKKLDQEIGVLTAPRFIRYDRFGSGIPPRLVTEVARTNWLTPMMTRTSHRQPAGAPRIS